MKVERLFLGGPLHGRARLVERDEVWVNVSAGEPGGDVVVHAYRLHRVAARDDEDTSRMWLRQVLVHDRLDFAAADAALKDWLLARWVREAPDREVDLDAKPSGR